MLIMSVYKKAQSLDFSMRREWDIILYALLTCKIKNETKKWKN